MFGCLLLVMAAGAFGQSPGSGGNLLDEVEFTIAGRCEKPVFTGEIPDGALSSEAELLAAQAQIGVFIREMDDYIRCANEGLRIVSDYTTEEFGKLLDAIGDAARADVDTVVDAFWDEVVEFGAVGGSDARRRPAQLPAFLPESE